MKSNPLKHFIETCGQCEELTLVLKGRAAQSRYLGCCSNYECESYENLKLVSVPSRIAKATKGSIIRQCLSFQFGCPSGVCDGCLSNGYEMVREAVNV